MARLGLGDVMVGLGGLVPSSFGREDVRWNLLLILWSHRLYLVTVPLLQQADSAETTA